MQSAKTCMASGRAQERARQDRVIASLAMTIEELPCSLSTSRPAQVRWRCTSRCMRSAFRSRAGRCRSRTTCAHPDFLALNPEGKVPVLLVDGRPLTEVAAILFYLAKRFPDAELLPRDDLEAEAQALSWMSFIASTLHPRAPARAGLRQRGLRHCRSQVGQRLGAGALFDRRHPSVPAVLAARQFASPRAGNVPEPHRALSAHDGAARGATNHRDRNGDRI